MHKDKKITLLPLSPADIRKHFHELAEIEKNTPPGNESFNAKPKGIKLKEGVYLATNSAAAELCDNHDAPCYTMLCRYVSSTHDPMSCTLHPIVTNFSRKLMMGWSRGRLQFKKGRMMRTSPHWTCTNRPHLQVTSRLQLGLHVRLGFSQHPCTVSVISPSYKVGMR